MVVTTHWDEDMWYLIEDFFDQSWFMKAILGLGWLCVIIMLASFGAPLLGF